MKIPYQLPRRLGEIASWEVADVLLARMPRIKLPLVAWNRMTRLNGLSSFDWPHGHFPRGIFVSCPAFSRLINDSFGCAEKPDGRERLTAHAHCALQLGEEPLGHIKPTHGQP